MRAAAADVVFAVVAERVGGGVTFPNAPNFCASP